MNFREGQELLWIPKRAYEPRVLVVVVALRSCGAAKLSNGWVVDEDGIAQGTSREPGGRVVAPDTS